MPETSQFVLSSNPVAYTGATALLAACIWNTWPRRAAAIAHCPACEPGAHAHAKNGEEKS